MELCVSKWGGAVCEETVASSFYALTEVTGSSTVSGGDAVGPIDGSGKGHPGWVRRHSVVRWAIVCWCAAVAVRFGFMWGAQFGGGGAGRVADPWLWGVRASLVVATEGCLLGAAVVLAVVVPLLITTWTTVLVCELLFGHMVTRAVDAVNRGGRPVAKVPTRDKLIRSGSDIARDIAGLSAAKSGAVTVCCVAVISIRIYLRDL